MEYYELHPVTPQIRYINKAVEVLKSGGIIIYPTDTVYGLGCDIYNKAALERLFAIKQDTNTKLFSFVCPDLKDISKYAKVSDYAYKAMKHLLPGPYTFVLPAAKEVPKKLWTKRRTVGIRVPKNIISITLARELGNPLVSTSACKRAGEILNNPEEIKNIFNSQVDLMLSAGHLNGQVSSIIDLSTDGGPEIIRIGAGDVSMFE
jgi:tRNA threonylcarbamoyl adenosine modification protein (Sua5/YciO/YrdC/YwlC family)